MIRLLIADDDVIVRKDLRSELAATNDIDVIGEADNSQIAVTLTEKLHPDVVLLDETLPPIPISLLITQLRATTNSLQIIILAFDSELRAVLDMLQAGASGYFLHNDAPSLLLQAIRAVYSGLVCFSPTVRHRCTKRPTDWITLFTANTSTNEDLSVRERDVLRWMALGLSNAQIAKKLMISPATVKNHITSIYAKLAVHSPREAIAWAWMNGLVQRERE
ncbi:MAG: DNA-binding response regulator [Candidatus Roseilinea sp.]|nr:MAG: DNA-binding response regulator [Candidatus Roseilinea sp.]